MRGSRGREVGEGRRSKGRDSMVMRGEEGEVTGEES